jgi:hypothetical protein
MQFLAKVIMNLKEMGCLALKCGKDLMPIREGVILCLLIAIRSLPLLLRSRHNMGLVPFKYTMEISQN